MAALWDKPEGEKKGVTMTEDELTAEEAALLERYRNATPARKACVLATAELATRWAEIRKLDPTEGDLRAFIEALQDFEEWAEEEIVKLWQKEQDKPLKLV